MGRVMRVDDYGGEASHSDALRKLKLDGFAIFPRAFDEQELEDLRRATTDLQNDSRINRDRTGKRTNIVFWPATVSPLFQQLRTDSRFFTVAQVALGTDDPKEHIQHIFCRGPYDSDSFRWHRDEIFRGPRLASPRDNYLQIALYLDDVDSVDQGAVVFIPGSHRERDDKPLADAEAIETRTAGAWPMTGYPYGQALLARRGTIAAWNPGTIHGSQPNTTDRHRRYILQGYARADAVDDLAYKWAWRSGKPVPLVSPADGSALGSSLHRA